MLPMTNTSLRSRKYSRSAPISASIARKWASVSAIGSPSELGYSTSGRATLCGPFMPRLLKPQFLQLPPVHRGRRPGHQVAGLLVLREGDHVADVRRPGQHHRPAVDAERDAPVRRRPVLQGVEQEAET